MAKGISTGRGLGVRLRAWATHHVESALGTLARLTSTPLATLMTVAVIGIAMALPAGLYAATGNLRALADALEQTTGISVFLRNDVDEDRAQVLANELQSKPAIATAAVISRSDALEEFRHYSGFGEALDQLSENPLPCVLTLLPSAEFDDAASIAAIEERIRSMPEVDSVRVDTRWIQRFQGLVELARRSVSLLGGLLALAVLLVVSNTIRLEIENRRDEIVIMELVGATPGFIRRPFIYAGAWYGLLGGIVAWFLIAIALAALQGPVDRLANLYQTQFALSGLDATATLVLLGSGLALGLVGSAAAVTRHLRAIEPN